MALSDGRVEPRASQVQQPEHKIFKSDINKSTKVTYFMHNF